MATYQVKINSRSYQNSNGQPTFSFNLVVKDAATFSALISATAENDSNLGLPGIGDPLENMATAFPTTNPLGAPSGLFLRDYTYKPISDSKDDAWEVSLTYGGPVGPGGGNTDPNARLVTWTTGVAAQHITEDLDGQPIGRRYLFRQATGPSEPDNYIYATPFEDMDAEQGADVFIPTIDFEVRMPYGTILDVPLFVSLTGTVNRNPLTVGGVVIPERHCLYQGYSAQQALDGGFEITHRFSVGRSYLPEGVPTFVYFNGNYVTWPPQDPDYDSMNPNWIPIQFGYYGRYKALVQKKTGDTGDPLADYPITVMEVDDIPLVFQDKLELVGKEIDSIVIFKAYKDKLWTNLGIEDPVPAGGGALGRIR